MSTAHYDYIIRRVAAAKHQADGLCAQMNHRGLEGQIRELAARECLEPFLTQSFRCGTGKVIDSLQTTTDQTDLIVYHRKVAPPILVNQELGLFPVECVRYVVEVKSTLTATQIRDANTKFESVRRLRSFPKINSEGNITSGALPTTVLLAFGSDTLGSELDRYRKHTETLDHPPCTVLCVLGKGYWFYDASSGNWHGEETRAQSDFREFCMFVTGFMNTLSSEETSIRPFLPGAYVNVGDIRLQKV